MEHTLKKGGELFCGIPFIQPYHPSPHDYWRVSKEGMRYLFNDLKELSMTSGNDAVSTLAWLNMRFVYNILPRKIDIVGRVVVILFKPLQFLERKLDRWNLRRKEYDGMQGMAQDIILLEESHNFSISSLG